MELKTERLVIKEIEEQDKEYLVRNVNNLNVSRYLAVVPYPYTNDDADWFINHCKEERERKPRINYEMGINYNDELVGVISVLKVKDKKGTLGYWLGEPYWRKGIMSEALVRIIDYAFNELNLNELEASVFIENKASAGLLEKFGFEKKTTDETHHCKATGKTHNLFKYHLYKKE